MERITIFIRTTKTDGNIRLRFRLQDGRNVDIYHKSNIVADLKDIAKFTEEGQIKPKISIYNKGLFDSISNEISTMKRAYAMMIDKGIPLNGDAFEKMIEKQLHPAVSEENLTLLNQFNEFVDKCYRDGVIGEGRLKHYLVTQRELQRFLIVKDSIEIKVSEFDEEWLMEYRNYLINEFTYVESWRGLFSGLRASNVPIQKRSTNTVSQKLNQLQAFFTFLEDKDIIPKSPFRKLGKNRKSVALKEEYDEPVYLTSEEFQTVRCTVVPKNIQETKDAFLLQCTLGCRISDYKRMGMDNIAVTSEGIPYVRYLPVKTKGKSKEEIETPLMRFALEIIKKYEFSFRILKYVSGERGYNDKIKTLLELCGINRECKVFSSEQNDNIYRPLYDLASSKLCRKTFVDIMNKVQVNLYAAGLHKEGSDAVNRYTMMGIRERFTLMCAAFAEPDFRVDTELNII